jgi:hypothetical protein
MLGYIARAFVSRIQKVVTLSAEEWRRVIWYLGTNLSEEVAASIYMTVGEK